MLETQKCSLLDILAQYAGCQYLSELHYIRSVVRLKLIQKIEAISSDDFPLHDWNDALDYLISSPPKESVEDARTALSDYLRNHLNLPEPKDPIMLTADSPIDTEVLEKDK